MSLQDNTKIKWYTEWLIYALLLLMFLLFFYAGPIISWIVVIGVAILAARLIWKNFHNLLSRRDYNRFSPWELWIRQVSFTLSTFVIIILAGTLGMYFSKEAGLKKLNIWSNSTNNSEPQNKNETDSGHLEESHTQTSRANDTIASAIYPREKMSEDSSSGNNVSTDIVHVDTVNKSNNSNTQIHSLATITSDKAFFYKDTNVNFQKKHLLASKRTGAYCVKGDKVIVITATPNWVKVVYSKNSGEIVTEGWMRSIDL